MNIRGFINGGILGVTSLLLVSCSEQKVVKDCRANRDNLLEELMLDKPQAELNTIRANLSGYKLGIAQMQHSLDSVAFREMFEGSQHAGDSAFVTDYNNMMVRTKTPKLYDEFGVLVADITKLNNIIDEKVTTREKNVIKKSHILPKNGGKGYYGSAEQFLVDSVYHHKLFEKYNLLGKDGLKKFKYLCRKVRP